MKRTLDIISDVVALRDRTPRDSCGDRETLADAANELSSLNAQRAELLEALDWLHGSVNADPSAENYPGDREERLQLASAAAQAVLLKVGGQS